MLVGRLKSPESPSLSHEPGVLMLTMRLEGGVGVMDCLTGAVDSLPVHAWSVHAIQVKPYAALFVASHWSGVSTPQALVS